MFCQHCGARIPDNARFCASCGVPLGTAQAGGGYRVSEQGYRQTSPEEDARQNKAMAILAYFIFFIPLLASNQSRFARYHANQGLTVLLFGVGLSIISGIFNAIALVSLNLGMLGLFGILITILSLGLTALAIIGIINAAQGKMQPMPIIGSLFTIIQ